VSIVLTDEERETLVGWTRRRRSAAGLAQRSRIVLACERGATNMAVAAALGVSVPTVRRWRGRFAERRLDGLLDEPRPGQPRKVTDEQVEAVIVRTLESAPPDGGTHWSTRQMAAAVGLNQTAVSRIWRAFGLQPHRVEHWKLSKDPLFVEKVSDIVGLYLDPPERAIVLCVDEKSQIQALDRSAPTLPILPGTPARATHDYERHGTSSLFAALNATSGKVIRSLHARHRAVEFKKFLIKIEHEVPAELDVHLILDNYSTHKTPRDQELADPTPTLPPALHPHRSELDQPRRALVRRTHRPQTTPRHTPLRRRAQRRHPRLGRTLEREPQPLRLDQNRRPDPRHPHLILQHN
jgi:transposase